MIEGPKINQNCDIFGRFPFQYIVEENSQLSVKSGYLSIQTAAWGDLRPARAIRAICRTLKRDLNFVGLSRGMVCLYISFVKVHSLCSVILGLLC